MDIEIVCWIILASSCITACVAVAGMLSPKFKDTLPQCITMAGIAFGGFMVTLQIYVHGMVQVSGIALLSTAMAAYSLVTLVKYART
jgi:hypothetical protein